MLCWAASRRDTSPTEARTIQAQQLQLHRLVGPLRRLRLVRLTRSRSSGRASPAGHQRRLQGTTAPPVSSTRKTPANLPARWAMRLSTQLPPWAAMAWATASTRPGRSGPIRVRTEGRWWHRRSWCRDYIGGVMARPRRPSFFVGPGVVLVLGGRGKCPNSRCVGGDRARRRDAAGSLVWRRDDRKYQAVPGLYNARSRFLVSPFSLRIARI